MRTRLFAVLAAIVVTLSACGINSIPTAEENAKAKGLKVVLETIAQGGADRPVPKLAPPPLVVILPLVNTGIALSVVFDMVAKPVSIPAALGVIALGIVVTAGLAIAQRPRAASRREVRTTQEFLVPEGSTSVG